MVIPAILKQFSKKISCNLTVIKGNNIVNKGTFFKVNEGATNCTFSQRAGKRQREVDFAACGPPEGRGWDAGSVPLPRARVVTGLLLEQAVRKEGPQAPHVWGRKAWPRGL